MWVKVETKYEMIKKLLTDSFQEEKFVKENFIVVT